MSRRDDWQRVIERFPLEERSVRPEWRADRPRSPIDDIVATLDTPMVDARFILLGTVGTGKTTELDRLARARNANELVVALDLEQLLSSEGIGDAQALHRIEAWEVCLLAAVAVYRAAKDLWKVEFPEHLVNDIKSAWKAAQPKNAATATPELDFAKLAQGIAASASTALGIVAPGADAAAKIALATVPNLLGAGKFAFPFSRRSKQSLDEPAPQDVQQTLLNAVNAIIGHTQQQARPVLLVLDGLDRVREMGRARALFVESDLLARLACKLVLTGPFALRSSPQLAGVKGFWPRVLVNAAVLDQHNPNVHGPEIPFLLDVYNRRVADLGAPLITDEHLRQLAYYSGGRVREFVRLVGLTAIRAWQRDTVQSTQEQIEYAFNERRSQLESGLTSDHEALLRKVMVDPKHRLPNDPLAHEMLTLGHLLPYPDGTEWYYPHPLLLREFLR